MVGKRFFLAIFSADFSGVWVALRLRRPSVSILLTSHPTMGVAVFAPKNPWPIELLM